MTNNKATRTSKKSNKRHNQNKRKKPNPEVVDSEHYGSELPEIDVTCEESSAKKRTAIDESTAESVDKIQSSRLIAIEEQTFSKDQIEALLKKDSQLINNRCRVKQLEFILSSRENQLRKAGVTTFRGKKKEYYTKLIVEHFNIVVDYIQSLKPTEARTGHQQLEKKRILDFSNVRFRTINAQHCTKVFVMDNIQDGDKSIYTKVGEAQIVVDASDNNQPDNLDAENNCLIQFIRIERFQEDEGIDIGKRVTWRTKDLIDPDDFNEKLKVVETDDEDYALANDILLNQPDSICSQYSQAEVSSNHENLEILTHKSNPYEIVIASLHEKVQEQRNQIEEQKNEIDRLSRYKQLYFNMGKNVAFIQRQTLTVNKLLSECLDQSHKTSDNEEHFSFQFASKTYDVSESDWNQLSKNQPVVAMMTLLNIVVNDIGLDLKKNSYCLPKTNTAHAEGKIIIEEEVLAMIIKCAKNHLAYFIPKPEKEIRSFVGKALSHFHSNKSK